jgi:hypothetical protein
MKPDFQKRLAIQNDLNNQLFRGLSEEFNQDTGFGI